MHAVASISQSALAHNLSTTRRHSPKTKIVSMVKANAYGHKLDLINPLIENSDLLAVSELSEAKKLRGKTNKPILLLSGVYSNNDLQQAIKLDCQIVVHHKSQISIVNNSSEQVNVWIKIDTGMHRLGLSASEYNECLTLLELNSLINIECVMSHFACADEIDNTMNKSQLNKFNELTSAKYKRSMANSAAILSNTKSHFDYIRPGIMLYGISPFAKEFSYLKAAMKLSAPIMSIKTINSGESVGYGATWTADKKTTIAVIGIGYGDGYPRHAKNGTPVVVNNTICPLIGRVSMDLICVDISNINANIGDIATLWGDDLLSVETVADWSNTIGYELVTGLSSRVKFIDVA